MNTAIGYYADKGKALAALMRKVVKEGFAESRYSCDVYFRNGKDFEPPKEDHILVVVRKVDTGGMGSVAMYKAIYKKGE